MKELLNDLLKKLLCLNLFIFFVLPVSSNYKLRSYEFGGGGGSLDSNNYALEGVLGETSGDQQSQNFKIRSGLAFVQMANVPVAPTFVNPSNWYNKLKITINESGNPSDTKYAIAISTDSFATTQYIQNDNTVGVSLGIEDYQSYTDWGGASGENIIGLSQGTTYEVKVKAIQGEFTESPYGPTASASTSNATLDFDIDVSASDTETAAPYEVAFGSLSSGSVNTAASRVWVDLDTNSDGGGYIYVSDNNSGLKSTAKNYTISGVTGDLSSLSEGFGAQSASDTETSGGPLLPLSPFNGASQNVGIINTTIRELYSTSGAPISGGRGSFYIKVKPSNTTPASADYSDTLTIIASGTF